MARFLRQVEPFPAKSPEGAAKHPLNRFLDARATRVANEQTKGKTHGRTTTQDGLTRTRKPSTQRANASANTTPIPIQSMWGLADLERSFLG